MFDCERDEVGSIVIGGCVGGEGEPEVVNSPLDTVKDSLIRGMIYNGLVGL